jgi:hypothetical protein
MDNFENQRALHYLYWEVRGRGWLQANVPVMIEPPFPGEDLHDYPKGGNSADPYKLGGPISWFRQGLGRLGGKQTGDDGPSVEEWLQRLDESLLPYEEMPVGHCELKLNFPRDAGKDLLSSAFQALGSREYPLTFELLGDNQSMRVLLSCTPNEVDYMTTQVETHFPGIMVEESDGELESFVEGIKYSEIIEFCLADDFLFPLKAFDPRQTDPFTSIAGIFKLLEDGERLVYQVSLGACLNDWGKSISEAVIGDDGKSLFAGLPDLPKFAAQKTKQGIFACAPRVFIGTGSRERLKRLKDLVEMAMESLAMGQNRLVPINPPCKYPNPMEALTLRYHHRTGILLSPDELHGLVHFPSQELRSQFSGDPYQMTKQQPAAFKTGEFLLGQNVYRGQRSNTYLGREQRLRHTHVIGATGTGKSTLLYHMLKEDVLSGAGVALVDPHGDLVDDLLSVIPPSRHKDVILVDPSDLEASINLGILDAKDDIERMVLSSDLVGLFKRLSTSWGDQMNTVLANAVDAFLWHREGGSLLELRRFLTDKAFREEFLEGVEDESVNHFWKKEFPILKSNSVGPLAVRLDSFLRPRLIRRMLDTKTGIDFREAVNGGKIILLKLSQGLIGEENAFLLGSLVVAKLQQAAQSRQNMPSADRRPFYLYIDEFQYFAVPSMTNMLSGARKFGLGLVLAHQDLNQLAEQDAALLSAVLSNAGTRICFRLGDSDANRLEKGFSGFSSFDLQNLKVGQALVRVDSASNDFSMEVIRGERKRDELNMEAIRVCSRANHGKVDKPRDITPVPKEEAPLTDETPPVVEPLVEPVWDTQEQGERFKEQLQRRAEIKEHGYLQGLIKKTVEGMGMRAIVEEETADGKGKVDVVVYLEQGRLAIEISVTTPVAQEIHNITKCLDNGYEMVVSLCSDPKHLEAIKSKAGEVFSPHQLERVSFLAPPDFLGMLNQLRGEREPGESKIKGYTVRRSFSGEGTDLERWKGQHANLIALISRKP